MRESQNPLALQQLANAVRINQFYFDESGFTTIPSVPYTWQPVGTTRELPSFPFKGLNVMGFMSRDRQAFFHSTGGKVDSPLVAEAFVRFAVRYAAEYAANGKSCIVTLDHAARHTSRAFLDQADRWAICGIIVPYWPPDYLELNRIKTFGVKSETIGCLCPVTPVTPISKTPSWKTWATLALHTRFILCDYLKTTLLYYNERH